MHSSAILFLAALVCFTAGEESKTASKAVDDPFETIAERKRRSSATLVNTISSTDESRQNFVDVHNFYRRQVQPQASNMREVSWDDELEELATNYSKKCILNGHEPAAERMTSQFSVVGQNKAGTFNATYRNSINRTVKVWFEESKNFNFTDGSCQPGQICGRYLQLVWWETYKIGCGVSYCRNLLQRNSAPGYLFVCNYGPAGNRITINAGGTSSSMPYLEGNPGSACDCQFSKSNNGLCSKSSDDAKDCSITTTSSDATGNVGVASTVAESGQNAILSHSNTLVLSATLFAINFFHFYI